MKIGVLGADFSTGNLGVNALTEGTLCCILKSFPCATIFLLNYGRLPSLSTLCINGKEIKVPLVNMRFSKKFYLPNNIAILFLLLLIRKVLPWRTARRALTDSNSSLHEIETADVFVSVSGGDSFSDIYGFGRLLYVALPQLLVLLAGKQLVQVPQSYGPFDSRIAKAIARFILSRSGRIYSRDFVGVGQVREILGIQSDSEKVRFCYDVGFAVVPRKPMNMIVEGLAIEGRKGEPLVGMNVSGLLLTGGYTGQNMFGLGVDYESLMCDLVEHLVQDKKVAVVLVPHVLSAGESDVAACEKVFNSLKDKCQGRIGIVRGEFDQGEVKYVIGCCDLFVGSRMHACIAALSQYVPAISIAYSDKFSGVMETIGVTPLVADARNMTSQQIVAVVSNVYDQRDQWRRHLKAKMPEVQHTIMNLFEFVRA